MSPVRLVRLLGVALAAAALLAGCGTGAGSTAGGSPSPSSPATTTQADNGVADLTATQILARAKSALAGAESVHLKGSGRSEGAAFGIDMRCSPRAGTGSFTAKGVTVNLLRTGSTLYLKGSEAFWRTFANPTVAELLKGRYLKVSATAPEFADLAAFTDPKKNADAFLSPKGALTKGERKTIRGVDTIGLKDTSKDGGILYIALQGEPYPLQLQSTSTDSSESGSLDFLEYGAPVTVTAPPADQVIDSSKLGGR